jgi:hypothetical protein
MLSWFPTRSVKYSLLTLACAGIVHSVSIAVAFHRIETPETRSTPLADPDSVFQTYAVIQDIRVQIREPYPEFWGNPHPEYGTAFQWARVLVTVEVSHPGIYGVDAHYGFRTDQVSGSSPWTSTRKHLAPGRHVIPIEFRHNEIGSPYAFWDTTFVGGNAMARLSYFASDQELLDAVGGDAGFEEYLRENREGGTISTDPNSERSIGTMEVRFEHRRKPIAVAPEAPREYHFPMGSPDEVHLTVSRIDGGGSTTYRYSLENRSRESLFSFMIGAIRSSPTCPELRYAPVGYVENASECPGGISIRRKWRGCVGKREDCDGYFLNIGYPDGEGLVPGKSLTFTVMLTAPDSTYEHASFWIVGRRNQYEGRARPVG